MQYQLERDLSSRVYTTFETAKIFRISQSTILRLFDSGKIKGYKIPPICNHRRITHKSIVEFARENHLELLLDDYFGKGKY